MALPDGRRTDMLRVHPSGTPAGPGARTAMPISSRGRKPRNPRTKPFFPHASGYWAAKIGGRTQYLARWQTPPSEVERLYHERKRALEEASSDGPEVAVGSDTITVKQVANLFVNGKAAEAEAGDLSWLTWRNYQNELVWFTEQIGHRPAASLEPPDFARLNAALKAKFNYNEHRRRVATLRMAVRWAFNNGYIDREPRFGTQFKAPGQRQCRKERAKKVSKLFAAPDLQALVEAAEEPMQAMILLGINCAYLQSDLAELMVQFEDGSRNRLHLGQGPFIRFDRPKTGERRKCPLWPETVEALKKVIGDRTKGRVFETRRGMPLVHIRRSCDEQGRVLRATHCDAVSKAFRELRREVGCYAAGRGFSALRSTFEARAWHITGLDAANFAAIHWIMGHGLRGPEVSKMADVYVQDIEVATLQLVTDRVRDWYLHSGK